MATVPASQHHGYPAQREKGAAPLMLHIKPAMAMNHTSTDRSTCTTSAVRKKSTPGSSPFTTGARDKYEQY